MEVDAFLADSVESVDGKLYVLGAAWNILTTTQLPTRHPRIGVGIIIHVPYTATNQMHRFEVYLLDADDTELPLGDVPPGAEESNAKVRRFGGQFNVGRPPTLQPGDEQLVPLALNIDGLMFERADTYRFVIELDGSREKFLPFRVYHHVQPGAMSN
jgi:hypothetical protein